MMAANLAICPSATVSFSKRWGLTEHAVYQQRSGNLQDRTTLPTVASWITTSQTHSRGCFASQGSRHLNSRRMFSSDHLAVTELLVVLHRCAILASDGIHWRDRQNVGSGIASRRFLTPLALRRTRKHKRVLQSTTLDCSTADDRKSNDNGQSFNCLNEHETLAFFCAY